MCNSALKIMPLESNRLGIFSPNFYRMLELVIRFSKSVHIYAARTSFALAEPPTSGSREVSFLPFVREDERGGEIPPPILLLLLLRNSPMSGPPSKYLEDRVQKHVPCGLSKSFPLKHESGSR